MRYQRLSAFESLTRDLAAIDFAHDHRFTKAMSVNYNGDLSDIDALLMRHGELDDNQKLLCMKAMHGGYRLNRGPTPDQMLKSLEAREASADRSLRKFTKETDQLMKSLSKQARRGVNIGAEIAKAREFVWSAKSEGKIDTRTANEADLRLRNFALHKLQRLQGR